jgi:hypothetical protein
MARRALLAACACAGTLLSCVLLGAPWLFSGDASVWLGSGALGGFFSRGGVGSSEGAAVRQDNALLERLTGGFSGPLLRFHGAC